MSLKSLEQANLYQLKEDKKKERIELLKRITGNRVFQIIVLGGGILLASTAYGQEMDDTQGNILSLPTCEFPEYILGVIPPAPRNPELCYPIYIIPDASKKGGEEFSA